MCPNRSYAVSGCLRLLFGRGRVGTANQIAGPVFVAVVRGVGPGCTLNLILDLEATVGAGEAREFVRLAKSTNRVRDVIEFGVDGDSNFAQADNQSDDDDRHDQDVFGGQDCTTVIIPEFAQHD